MDKMGLEEFLAGCGINRKIKVYKKDKEGGSVYTLKEIGAEYLYALDSVGFRCKLAMDSIAAIEWADGVPDRKGPVKKEEAAGLKKLIKEKNDLRDKANLDTLELFRNEISILSEKVDSALLKEYLTNSRSRMVLLDEMQAEEFLVSFQKMFERGEIDRYVMHIGSMVVCIAGRKFKECIAQCFQMLHGADRRENKRKGYLCLAYVMNRLKDEDQSFYWLEKYFLEGTQILREDSSYPLWWRYLANTVGFGSFERLGGILQQVYEFDKNLAYESLAYVLAQNNAQRQANYLVSCMEQAELSWDTLHGAYQKLDSEKDNKYHRFLKCADDILSNGKYKTYDKDQGIDGLVYEYVPMRSYGFIIGYDMIKYFFHSECASPRVIKDIKASICTIKSVEEEELCKVAFSRNSECKRVYEAYDVV